MWARLCEALGLSRLIEDPRFRTNPQRVLNREALLPILQEVLDEKGAWQWEQILKAHNVACSQYFQDEPTSHLLSAIPRRSRTATNRGWSPAHAALELARGARRSRSQG